MLSREGIKSFKIKTSDNKEFQIEDVLINEKNFNVSHFVINLGSWLSKEKKLISPRLIDVVDLPNSYLELKVSSKELEHCPSAETHEPVSSEMKNEKNQELKIPVYWGGTVLGGLYTAPYDVIDTRLAFMSRAINHKVNSAPKTNNTRSMEELIGYSAIGIDGGLGTLSDMIIDEYEWTVASFVIEDKSMLDKTEYMVSTNKLESIDYSGHCAYFNLRQDDIRDMRVFNPNAPVNKAYIKRHFDFNGRPKNWGATQVDRVDPMPLYLI